MPNHTDNRAYFVGEPRDIARMRKAMLRARLMELIGERKAAQPKGALSDWSALEERHFGMARETSSAFGLIPDRGSEAPFTLKAGKAMPASLLGEEGSVSALGDELIGGAWEKYKGYPHTQWLRAAQTREQALELAKTHAPEALEAGLIRQQNLQEHGARGWYDWSVRNWGTKWDAYDSIWGKSSSKGRIQEARFQSAWSPPLPGLQALCKKFNLGCSVGYVDEGGGFASLTVFKPDGSAREDVEDYLSKQRSLWPRARAEARALTQELAERLSAGPKTRRKKSASFYEWAASMSAGEEPRGEMIDPAKPGEGEGSAAERFIFALGDGEGMSSGLGARWLEALGAAGALSPEDDALDGRSLREVLLELCWEPGFLWAARNANEKERQIMAKRALAKAIIQNAPGMAAGAYAMLDEAERPAPNKIRFSARPEAYCAIAMSPAVSNELFEAFYAHAQESLSERLHPNCAEAFKTLASRFEAVQISGATSLGGPKSQRPSL